MDPLYIGIFSYFGRIVTRVSESLTFFDVFYNFKVDLLVSS